MGESSSKRDVILHVLMSNDCLITGTCVEGVDVSIPDADCIGGARSTWLLDKAIAVIDRRNVACVKFRGPLSFKTDIDYAVKCDVMWLDEHDAIVVAFIADAQRQVNAMHSFDVAKSFGVESNVNAEMNTQPARLDTWDSMDMLTSFKSFAASLAWTEALSCGQHKNGNSQQGAQWVHKGIAEIDISKWLSKYNEEHASVVEIQQAAKNTISIYVVKVDEFQLVYGYVNQLGAIVTGAIYGMSNYAFTLSSVIRYDLVEYDEAQLIFITAGSNVADILIRDFNENDHGVSIECTYLPTTEQRAVAEKVYSEWLRVHGNVSQRKSTVQTQDVSVGVAALLDAVAASPVPVTKDEAPAKGILDGVTALGKINTSDFDPKTVLRIWVSAASIGRQYVVVQSLGELIAATDRMPGRFLHDIALDVASLVKKAYRYDSPVHVIVDHRGFGSTVARRIQLECGRLAHVEMTTESNDYPEMLARVVFDGASHYEIKRAEDEPGVPGKVYFASVPTVAEEDARREKAVPVVQIAEAPVVTAEVKSVVVEQKPALIDWSSVFDRCGIASDDVTCDALSFIESRLILDWTEFDASTKADLKRIALDIAQAFVSNRSTAPIGRGVDGYKMLDQSRVDIAEINARYTNVAEEIRSLRGR